MSRLKTLFLVLMMATALAITGCGGGGGTTAEVEEPPAVVEPTEEEKCAAEGNTYVNETCMTPAQYKAHQCTSGGGIVNEHGSCISAAEQEAQKKAQEESDRKMRAAVGKALFAALEGPNDNGSQDALDNNESNPTIGSAGLSVDVAAGAGILADDALHDALTLKKGDSIGSLGIWNGTGYSHSDSKGKILNDARVYDNKGPGKSVSLADAGIDVHTDATAGDDRKGYYTVNETADLAKIMSPAFLHSGTQNHAIPDRGDAVYIRGTLDGAPGEYRCTGACSSSNDGKGSPSRLGGEWHFKPDPGAMVHQPDNEYLYFGWWVSKNSDGDPTAASAFVGVVEPNAGDLDTGGDLTAITGSATYNGHAVGKFALTGTLGGDDNGGHFTADAELEATFSGTSPAPGVTGTIDNFRLNDGDEDPGWSVSLARGALGSSNGTITAPTGDPTVWSIGGVKAKASGTWSGTMYDEKPGDPPGGDGSNIPTTVTGTFYTEYSDRGRMVGAFGATHTE